MAVKYVAGRRLSVADEIRMPGDEVPEAATWKNLPSYISFGSIVVVEVGEEAPSPAPAPEPEPEPVEEAVEEPETEEVDLSSMLKDDLIALAEERGLDTSGTKADLIERLS